MRDKIIAACSVAIVLIGLSLHSLGGHAQSTQMARREPHMSAAYGHLQQARAELDKAAPNKGDIARKPFSSWTRRCKKSSKARPTTKSDPSNLKKKINFFSVALIAP